MQFAETDSQTANCAPEAIVTIAWPGLAARKLDLPALSTFLRTKPSSPERANERFRRSTKLAERFVARNVR
jgi:hypothetical protein